MKRLLLPLKRLSFMLPFRTCFILLTVLLSFVSGTTLAHETSLSHSKHSNTPKGTLLTSSQLAHELQGYLKPVKTLKAQFKQVTTDAKGRKLQKTQGVMQIKFPALFRWQINRPFPQLLVSNGKKIWMYDQALQQVTIRPLDQRSSTVPAAILSGDTASLTKNYHLAASGTASHRTFILTPRKKDSLFENLQLTFNRQHLASMALSDSLGTHTTITFSHVVENQPINAKQFTFKPPKGVDVLDETRR